MKFRLQTEFPADLLRAGAAAMKNSPEIFNGSSVRQVLILLAWPGVGLVRGI